MTLTVPDDLQLSLLEFIADLNAENYEDVPMDLVKLQFVPEQKLEELRSSGLTYAISNMLKLAAEGGGPKGAMQRMVAQNKEKFAEALKEFDDLDSKEATEVRQRLFKEEWQREMAEDAMSRGDSPTSTTVDLTMKIEQMQNENADVFAIPDYFVYMSRAFSTLEGIGLSSDSNYSILQECYPYLAKRLISDDSPRARGALRTLLYGKGDDLDLSKLQELTNGFESYTSSTSSVESSRGVSDEGRNAAIEQLANVVLSEDSNYVQELLLRESAMALDVTIRNAITSPLKPIRSLLIPPQLRPFALPLELAKAALELQAVDERDTKRLENVRILTELLSRGNNVATGSVSDIMNAGNRQNSLPLGKLIQETSKRQKALTRIGVRFGGSLASIQAERLRDRISVPGAKKVSTGENDHHASVLADGLASRGADTLETLVQLITNLDSDLSQRL